MYKIMIIRIFKYLFNNTLGTGFCAVNLISIVACQYFISVLADSPPMSRHWPQVEWHQGQCWPLIGHWDQCWPLIGHSAEMAWVPSSGCHKPRPGDIGLCLFWKLWPGITWWWRRCSVIWPSCLQWPQRGRGGRKVLQVSQSKQIQHQRGTFANIFYRFMRFLDITVRELELRSKL